MEFKLKNDTLYLIDNKIEYTIATEDIQRLLMRPGTRVLRMKDSEGNITSTPLASAVGEIKGYELLKKIVLD